MIAASSVPVVVMLSHLGLWLLAGWELGHPPRPSLDDPKDITILRFVYLPVVLLGGLIPPAIIVCAVVWVLLLWNALRRRSIGRWFPVVLLPLVWIGFVAWVRYDPGQILVWIAD